ncbi:2Fe-2S iron-sulfur cluster-binding protein [Nonomuraea sp. NPDC050663]|uniref:2Fe-2S iron-sulfur cluster-binding protein n=1 Tax=Nonomuraea sp. NPDC050663 TaxID=3364370 RepID=UPI0037942515
MRNDPATSAFGRRRSGPLGDRASGFKGIGARASCGRGRCAKCAGRLVEGWVSRDLVAPWRVVRWAAWSATGCGSPVRRGPTGGSATPVT